MRRTRRASGAVAAALWLLTASAAAQEPPPQEAPSRSLRAIWAEVVDDWARLSALAQVSPAEMAEDQLVEIEALAQHLLELMLEIERSLELPHAQRVPVRRASRFVALRLGPLQRGAARRIPGEVPRTVPPVHEQLWALQVQFPEGTLGEPSVPKPEPKS